VSLVGHRDVRYGCGRYSVPAALKNFSSLTGGDEFMNLKRDLQALPRLLSRFAIC
jgi:hypothetical protein